MMPGLGDACAGDPLSATAGSGDSADVVSFQLEPTSVMLVPLLPPNQPPNCCWFWC